MPLKGTRLVETSMILASVAILYISQWTGLVIHAIVLVLWVFLKARDFSRVRLHERDHLVAKCAFDVELREFEARLEACRVHHACANILYSGIQKTPS